MSAIRVRKGGETAAQLRVLFPAIAKLLIGRWKWGLPQRYLCETVLENWNGHVHKILFWIHVVKISQIVKAKAFEIPKFQNSILSLSLGFYSLEKKKFTNSCPYKWNYKKKQIPGVSRLPGNLSAQSYPFSSLLSENKIQRLGFDLQEPLWPRLHTRQPPLWLYLSLLSFNSIILAVPSPLFFKHPNQASTTGVLPLKFLCP